MVGWIKMKLGMQVGLGPGHIVLDGDPATAPPKGHSLANFWPISVVAKWLDRPRPSRLCVRSEPSCPIPKKGTEPPPQFSAHVLCGQTAGCIKMALGMEVGFGPGHVVLDGDQLPCTKKGQSPLQNFPPISIVAK